MVKDALQQSEFIRQAIVLITKLDRAEVDAALKEILS
jgi:hypothetical protein